MSTPREKPILMSAPMVRAILSGSKTQTRRVVKPACGVVIDAGGYHWPFKSDGHASHAIDCPYGQPGDRLWVREAWRQAYPSTSFSNGIIYRADAFKACGMVEYSDLHRWKPSIHMRRSDSRILLEITAVRVERLQNISEADAVAEGWVKRPEVSADPQVHADAARDWYSDLWEQINGPGSWSANPFCWVVEFRRVTA